MPTHYQTVLDFDIREVIIKIINVYKTKLLYLHSINGNLSKHNIIVYYKKKKKILCRELNTFEYKLKL